MGHIFGKAAVLDGKDVTLTKSYGPEARGGACSTDIIVSDKHVYYPQVRDIDILVSMSQSALDTYEHELKEDGLLIIDTGLVESSRKGVIGIKATKIAEDELNLRMVANIVMLGYLAAKTEIISKKAMEDAVSDLVPKGTVEKNLKAFQRGFDEWNEE